MSKIEWWRSLIVGVSVLAIVAYLFLSDTLPAIGRYAKDPEKPLPAMVFARLNLCALGCFIIVPVAELATAFRMPGYWLAGPALLLGFVIGRWWELLKRI